MPATQLPLAELAGTFYSTLKSQTSGYATFDYEPGPHRSADLVRLDFLIHGSPVDALSRVLHRADAVTAARAVCKKLIGAVSRQAFEVCAVFCVANAQDLVVVDADFACMCLGEICRVFCWRVCMGWRSGGRLQRPFLEPTIHQIEDCV